MGKAIDVRRRQRRGEVSAERIVIPDGWEVSRLPAAAGVSPLRGGELPSGRSIPLPAGKTVVIVNDAQRPTPTPWLMERLDVDWEREDVFIAVATGSHAPPGAEELREIFGPFLERIRPRLVLHRGDGSDMIRVGRTSRGTPIEVNRLLEGSSSVFALGSVEPHYFAGWTGGRKSLVPGLCSLTTIRANHRLALEGGRPGSLEECPVHHDLVEGTAIIDRWLQESGPCLLAALNVIHREGVFYGSSSGPLASLVEQLVPRAREVYGRPLEHTFPVVLCLVDHPLDRDFYQSLKALENWKSAVADGGVLVLAADCLDGMGPPTFTQFQGRLPGLEDLSRQISEEYHLGDHKLASFLRYRDSGRSMLLLSHGPLHHSDVPVTVVDSISAALSRAGTVVDPSRRRVLVVEDAGHCYPLFSA
jgi:nickel-dependent lactate racemase